MKRKIEENSWEAGKASRVEKRSLENQRAKRRGDLIPVLSTAQSVDA